MRQCATAKFPAGGLVEGVYPGAKSSLPGIGESVEVLVLDGSGVILKGTVAAANKETHTYTVAVAEYTDDQEEQTNGRK